MNKDVKIILERIEEHFKRVPNTRYTVNVVNNVYDEQYNFFFVIQKRNERMKSVPLHLVNNYDLENLENIINEIKAVYKLSFDYTGFTGQRWPNSWQVIQKKRKPQE